MDTYVAVHAYAPRSVQRAMIAGVACTGLHRHTVMAMIAHAFLQSRRLKQAKKKRTLDPPAQPTLPAVRAAIIATFEG